MSLLAHGPLLGQAYSLSEIVATRAQFGLIDLSMLNIELDTTALSLRAVTIKGACDDTPIGS